MDRVQRATQQAQEEGEPTMTVSLQEFKAGAPLEYKGFDKKKRTMTVVGAGSLAIEDSRGKVEFLDVPEQCVAPLFYNLTRR
jgi:hypothetical protein